MTYKTVIIAIMLISMIGSVVAEPFFVPTYQIDDEHGWFIEVLFGFRQAVSDYIVDNFPVVLSTWKANGNTYFDVDESSVDDATNFTRSAEKISLLEFYSSAVNDYGDISPLQQVYMVNPDLSVSRCYMDDYLKTVSSGGQQVVVLGQDGNYEMRCVLNE